MQEARPLDYLRAWFAEEELVTCPRCDAKAAVSIAVGSTVCTECGHVGLPAAATDVAADARGAAG